MVIRHAFVLDPACTVIGRGFYYQTDGVQPLGGGAELWPGFQQARKRLARGGLLDVQRACCAGCSERAELVLRLRLYPQSLKVVQAGMMINLDSSFAAFMSAKPLPELLQDLCGRNMNANSLRAAGRSLSGFRVRADCCGRKGSLQRQPLSPSSALVLHVAAGGVPAARQQGQAQEAPVRAERARRRPDDVHEREGRTVSLGGMGKA